MVLQIQEGSADIQSSDSSSQLTISSGQQEHCGCYTIELRNSFGLRQAALNLTIVGELRPLQPTTRTSLLSSGQ